MSPSLPGPQELDDAGEDSPFAAFLVGVETDSALLGELKGLEHDVELDTAQRLEAAEAAVSQLKDGGFNAVLASVASAVCVLAER